MEKVLITTSEQDTIDLAARFAKGLFPGAILTLHGQLGAGKTTFTKGIAIGLGITQDVTSPTFTIMKQYAGSPGLTHIDAYRLEGIGFDYDLEEAIYSDNISVIEWSEHIQDSIEGDCAIYLSKVDTTCTLRFVYDERYLDAVEQL
jgi:tRNA threonylcarbamoyladenosine biosynthesis protein TsaE